MLEDQLLLLVCFEHNAIPVERLHSSREFDTTDQINRDGYSIPTGIVEKRVLNVLSRHLNSQVGSLLLVNRLHHNFALCGSSIYMKIIVSWTGEKNMHTTVSNGLGVVLLFLMK